MPRPRILRCVVADGVSRGYALVTETGPTVAFNALGRFGITVVRGVSGSAAGAVKALAEGALVDQAELCHHEDCPDDHHQAPGPDLHVRRN